jgi:hypothetical protein
VTSHNPVQFLSYGSTSDFSTLWWCKSDKLSVETILQTLSLILSQTSDTWVNILSQCWVLGTVPVNQVIPKEIAYTVHCTVFCRMIVFGAFSLGYFQLKVGLSECEPIAY